MPNTVVLGMTMNPLPERTFTLRQIAAINNEKAVTLQSWADKGWARISPAPGVGQTRQLTIVDAYMLSVACAFSKLTNNPKLANRIAYLAIHDDSHKNSPNQLPKAFINRDLNDSYLLFAQVGQFSYLYSSNAQELPDISVELVRVNKPHVTLKSLSAVNGEGYGFYMPLTAFLELLDRALLNEN